MQKKLSLESQALLGRSATTMPNPLRGVTPCTLPAVDMIDFSNNSKVTKTDRISVFIDGSNLFYAAFQLNIEVDYAKLLKQLVGDRRLLRAYFYTGVDPDNDKQKGFLMWMRHNGYRVVTKDLVQLPDGTKKANLDVEIAIDMITMAEHCQAIVLLSGDGDLSYALNSISYQGVHVEVVSLRSMTSDQLINVADRYTDLYSIQGSISKTSGV